MSDPLDLPLLLVVGGGGVGKTTLAAALGVQAAGAGHRTLVMTFDPSLRLKQALGVGDDARDREVPVPVEGAGSLHVSLLDARGTFDRLIRRHAPTPESAERIFGNRFYRDLAGHLAGLLEYMAVERLFEATEDQAYDRIVLDTPPTRQALDFLQAPSRVTGFLDSGAVQLAMKPWFDRTGRFRAPRLGPLSRGVEALLDRVIGVELVREVAEFFHAFAPLYDGFRHRAEEVQALLLAPSTGFLLVAGAGDARVPEAMQFARRLSQGGHRVAAVAVNQMHPLTPPVPGAAAPAVARGLVLLQALGARDQRGLVLLRELLDPAIPLLPVPLLATPPADLPALARLAARVGPAPA